jgi:hypothetical protein
MKANVLLVADDDELNTTVAEAARKTVAGNWVKPDSLRSNGNKKRTQFHTRGAALFQERA